MRKFTWVILAVNVLFAVWLIGGIVSVSSSSEPCAPSLSPEACTAASQVGGGIAAVLIIVLWLIADVILGILWLITRPKRRDCRVCGFAAKKGVMTCANCGTDFSVSAPAT